MRQIHCACCATEIMQVTARRLRDLPIIRSFLCRPCAQATYEPGFDPRALGFLAILDLSNRPQAKLAVLKYQMRYEWGLHD